MIKLRTTVLLVAAATLLASCGGEDERSDAAVPADTGTEAGRDGGMEGMSGMGGTDADMMGPIELHMQTMMSSGADSMATMLPMHRQMTANMIAQANREMREMNMTGDAAWTTTVDSLRSDLTRMPDMSAGELQSFMPAHHGRMMRLMEMHREMMGGLEM